MDKRRITSANIAAFREELILTEKGAATVEKYARDAAAFAAFADGGTITKMTVIAYKERLQETYAPGMGNMGGGNGTTGGGVAFPASWQNGPLTMCTTESEKKRSL